jgi:SAM-dependent methyltransferase
MTFSAIVFVISCLIIFCFVFVLLFGAPFLPTLNPQVDAALDLLDLKSGETILELGCGDGRVLIAAAKRGLYAVGYELNPIMALVSWLRTRKYRRQIKIICGNFWYAEWPEAQGIFGFILSRYMSKLHKKVMQYNYRPLRIASFAFRITEKEPTKIDRGIYLYEYK